MIELITEYAMGLDPWKEKKERLIELCDQRELTALKELSSWFPEDDNE
jgi:hypothetical protein